MAELRVRITSRWTERIFLLAISVALGFLFYNLMQVMQKDFAEVPERTANGTIVNLNNPKLSQSLAGLLQKGFYFEDQRDIHYIAAVIAKQEAEQENEVDNIGELNKTKYNVNAEDAWLNAGLSFKKRVAASRLLLGFNGDDTLRYQQEKTAPPQIESTNKIALGTHSITGIIANKNKQLVNGVLVRLTMILPQDSLYSESVSEVQSQKIERTTALYKTFVADAQGNRQLTSLIAYARTNAAGQYFFTGLPSNKAFEVLPLQPGFVFGSSRGVQELDGDAKFNFTQSPHTIKLFSTKDFNNLRKEKSLIVRTPAQAMQGFITIAIIFFAGFFLLHLIISFRFSTADNFVLPVLMLLTGLSLLTLLSLQDPLRDRFLAGSTAWYMVGGFAAMFLLLLFDLKKFTPDSGFYRQGIFTGNNGARGLHWAMLAALLLLLTIFLGSGPEGSGVKVNLFGFQPSEVVKFLVIIFLAGFFAANEKFISGYATMQKRWSFFSIALASIVLTILLFLALGDLGPAIVLCFTFIILFSFSRGDFAYAAGAVLLFVLSNWLFKNIWIATAVTAFILVLTMLFVRKQISESAIMALVVIAGFMLLDSVPFLDDIFPGPIQRLVDRKSIWLSKWDNEVFGGDQIANGIWAMASGGITGQGVGEGFAKTIPEAHTDMILPSLGEEAGWAGIVCVFILFLIYLHRSIVIGRQTGRPFLFYVCAGIGIGTFVQFLLIAGGSVGALPLSGVSLPFVSYGGSSLIMNMIGAGFLLSASLVRGTQVQMAYVSKQQDKNLLPALVAACVGLILLTVNVSRYLFNNKTWVVQPALVADRSGARMFSYNPRIAILINKLQAGSLYDRHGKLLATSKPQMVFEERDSLVAAGLDLNNLQALSRRRLDRYYPFAEQMFFWTGDANSNVFMGGINGYFAEYEHDAALRGFAIPTINYTVQASRFRENKFLPRIATEMTVTKKDYSVLAPLLLAGINSTAVDSFKQQNRDVQLTMDAALQTAIQKDFARDDSLINNRVSVVIIDDTTGDVLASAMHPLPPVNDWDRLTMPLAEQNKMAYWNVNTDLGFTYATQPGSTAKLATTLAAFNKLGMAATKKNILIRQQDLIRIKSAEPDEAGNISLERALVKSNNAYFIKLANEEKLQEEMATIYLQTGMFLRGVGGYYFERNNNNSVAEESWRTLWRKTEFTSLRSYNKNDIIKTRGRGVSGMAWGQGELIATPASVARLAAGISNNGKLTPHRFVLKFADSAVDVKDAVAIAKESQFANEIEKYMLAQSANKKLQLGITVAGKTGTPERIWKGERINDGWYVFFAPKATGGGNIVVCIRIEKTKGSSNAVRLAGKHIIPKLIKMGYLRADDKITVVEE